MCGVDREGTLSASVFVFVVVVVGGLLTAVVDGQRSDRWNKSRKRLPPTMASSVHSPSPSPSPARPRRLSRLQPCATLSLRRFVRPNCRNAHRTKTRMWHYLLPPNVKPRHVGMFHPTESRRTPCPPSVLLPRGQMSATLGDMSLISMQTASKSTSTISTTRPWRPKARTGELLIACYVNVQLTLMTGVSSSASCRPRSRAFSTRLRGHECSTSSR